MAGELLTPWPVWTWLEWEGHRAYFLEVVRPGWIKVEFLSGATAFWPAKDVREIRRP